MAIKERHKALLNKELYLCSMSANPRASPSLETHHVLSSAVFDPHKQSYTHK